MLKIETINLTGRKTEIAKAIRVSTKNTKIIEPSLKKKLSKKDIALITFSMLNILICQ